MEKNTEDQILRELQTINQSLKVMSESQEVKPGWELLGMVKALLLGILIVGPGIAVGYGILQILSSWISN